MTTHQPALVDLPGAAPPGHHQPGISADRRRTLRQAAALAAGHHPLGMYLRRTLKLHPAAAPADDRTAAGLRCRDCAFWRQVSGEHAGVFRKCLYGLAGNSLETAPRASRSAATDCRGWWSACVDYQPRPGKPENTEQP